jgi:hypothetical protein
VSTTTDFPRKAPEIYHVIRHENGKLDVCQLVNMPPGARVVCFRPRNWGDAWEALGVQERLDRARAICPTCTGIGFVQDRPCSDCSGSGRTERVRAAGEVR